MDIEMDENFFLSLLMKEIALAVANISLINYS